MEAFDAYLNGLVNKNKDTFSAYPDLKWASYYNIAEAREKREELMNKLEENWIFKDTKPYHKQISKGCMTCGLGSWSCLFITGKCNASCFYCPASQLADETPSTQGLNFETPESYAEYVNFFKFKGVSFSGGEPLLFLDRTLQYLKQVRKKCDPNIYTWMYTNGILAEEQKFRKLASAGLNEVRLDIGATGFKLDKIRFAKGIIPNITIEIPAIPEEKEKLKQLLPEMIKAGVTNLNLHQLRLTKHNAPKLSKRNYTYVHAEHPIVLESELTALEILNYARGKSLDIGINYCSFHFKNRFQKAGFRKQITNALAGPDEIITEKGFIRNFESNSIGYKAMVVSEHKSNENNREIQLKHKNYFVRVENSLSKTQLSDIQKTEVEKLVKTEPQKIPEDQLLFQIWQMEYIEKGLRDI
ncbi:radical SAM protein [Maribellus maritimus]|uniref:radical SAM protein n=1 Tax=Maribellus maritimus TaxID=2870838 RepID=UPI001EECF1E8|nr:radical SAM protein [Maribellus maritimus]MCG6190445.1 radical SAM protein [Maribellus maritimus]